MAEVMLIHKCPCCRKFIYGDWNAAQLGDEFPCNDQTCPGKLTKGEQHEILENNMKYLKFEPSECFCDFKTIPLPGHVTGLIMHLHYQYTHVLRNK